MTGQPLDLSGEGVLQATPLRVEFTRPSLPAPGAILVTGQRAELIRYEEYGAQAVVAGRTVRHDVQLIPEGESMGVFTDFRLVLDRVVENTTLALSCHGFLETAVPLTPGTKLLPADVDRAHPSANPVGPANPRYEFKYWPNGLTKVLQPNPAAEFAGSFNLQIEQAAFRMQAGQTDQSYESVRDAVVVSGVEEWKQTWFVLRVEQGTYHAAAVPSSMVLGTESVRVLHEGQARALKASGLVETAIGTKTINGADVDLPEEMTATAKSAKTSDETYTLSIVFAAVEAGKAPVVLSSPTLAATDWLPLGGVVAAFFVLGLATYGWRHNHLPKLAPAIDTPKKADPLAKPHHSVVDHVENTYRADPGNVQAALELGLTYGRAGRHEEALPLLLLSIQSFPRSESVRYHAALALLAMGRPDEAVSHLDYAFRLNPLNVARFLKEGPVAEHGHKPAVSALLRRWSRNFQESSNRGYA